MFVLTKRTAPSDKGNVMHSIHGFSENVLVARAWFRATRVTDVIEFAWIADACPERWNAQAVRECISDTRIPSWRELQLQDELKISGLAKVSRTA